MQSIKQIYKVGYGPSSSHTMGPAQAIIEVKKRHKEATKLAVTLFNSLALTGQGHLTNVCIKDAAFPLEVTIHNQLDQRKHPNTLIIQVYQNDALIKEYEVHSVGGGDIEFVGEAISYPTIYPHTTFKQIKTYCKDEGITLSDYVYRFEGEEIKSFLSSIYLTMKAAIDRGLTTAGVLPGPLKVTRKAPFLYNKIIPNEPSEVKESRLVSSYAFAVSEENASGGIIVTAPTCGACGVLPAVIYYMEQKHAFITHDRVINALAVAGLIGNLIKKNASISGAVCGCQAEIGSACSMAAAAHATLLKLSLNQVEYASEIALEHHLGLTCDPINGYVQIPCIERNAVAALRAIDACGLAYFLTDTRKISFDVVVKTMYETGRDMNDSYKETSKGGLATNYIEEEDINCW
jgi:L-serine dehydratase